MEADTCQARQAPGEAPPVTSEADPTQADTATPAEAEAETEASAPTTATAAHQDAPRLYLHQEGDAVSEGGADREEGDQRGQAV